MSDVVLCEKPVENTVSKPTGTKPWADLNVQVRIWTFFNMPWRTLHPFKPEEYSQPN